VLQVAESVDHKTPPRPAAPVSVDIAAALGGSRGGRSSPNLSLSRDQILDAAAACLADGGYESLTIRNLARRLDCAVGSIYRYFADKHELLTECGVRLMQPVVDELESPRPGYSASVDRYFAAAESDPQLYQLMFWLPRRMGENRLPAVIDRILSRWTELLGDSIEARRRFAAVHGQLTLGDPAGIALHIETKPESAKASEPQPVADIPEDITLL